MKNQDDIAPSPLVLKIKLDIRPIEDRENKSPKPVSRPPATPRAGLDTAIDANHLRALLEQTALVMRARPHDELCDLFLEVPEPSLEQCEGQKTDQVSLKDLFPTPLPAPAPIPPPGGWELEAPRDPQFLPEDSEADIELTLVLYV